MPLEKAKAEVHFIISAISSASWMAAHWLNSMLSAIVLGIAVVSAGLGLYWMGRMKMIEARKMQMQLCDQCRQGNEPVQCPISPAERPINCPKNQIRL